MIIYLTVKHHFSAGHRIPGLAGLGSKCASIHGHTFGVEWTFRVFNLDATEFEFAEAKKMLRGWVDENLDHGFLLAPTDSDLSAYLIAAHQKYYVVTPVPSTEAIAVLLLNVANELKIGAECAQVRVTEGPHNQATAVL